MRKFYILIMLISSLQITVAQEFKIDFSYKYLYSQQWDNIIQTYNFSRPFLLVKQPLFMHGFNSSASYIFKTTHHLQHGINASYSYFRSSAHNPNLSNTLNLHFINLGYILHYPFKMKCKPFYTDCIFSVSTTGLNRKMNGKVLEFDDEKSTSYGIGGEIGLKTGYEVQLKKQLSVSPFIGIGYAPYFYSPNHELLMNQTKGLAGNRRGGLLNAQIGVAFHFDKSK